MTGLQKTEHDDVHAKVSIPSLKADPYTETSNYLSFIRSYYSLHDRTEGAVREAIVDIPFYIFHESNDKSVTSFGFKDLAKALVQETIGKKDLPNIDESLLLRYHPDDFVLPEGITVTSDDINAARKLIYKEAGLVDGRLPPPPTGSN